ncbi:hypothetical protein D3C78_1465870 [compost metagenome]
MRVEQAQVGHQVVVLPGHQMAGVAFKVQAVNIRVGAVLLDNEHVGTQFEDGIQLFLAQVTVMFADPLDIHFFEFPEEPDADIKRAWPGSLFLGRLENLR